MRKMIFVTLALLALLLAGCSSASLPPAATAEPTPAPTAMPTPTPEPEPETVPGTVMYAPAPAVLAVLARGERVEILEDQGELCRVRYGELTGLMEKCLLRPASAAPYVPWTGYARHQAAVFDNFRLSGEGEALRANTELEVIDAYGDCLVVRVGEKTGCILASSVSEHPLASWSGDGGGSNSGAGGGSADGGDISLSAKFSVGGWSLEPLSAVSARPAFSAKRLSSVEEPSAPVVYSGAASVLADGAELVLTWFEPGDALRVLSADSERCTVYYDGQTASLSRFLVLVDGDAPYTPWEGYARPNAHCHSDYYLNDPEPRRLNANTVLSVIGELDTCYAVSLDGECVFLAKDFVSETKVTLDWGSGGSGSSGGTGSAGGGDWSPPAL